MKIGTKTILFGVHQFAIHPWFVAWAWWRLYSFPWDPRLWVAFFVHDLGYWGKPNMDGLEGERHPEFGARVMSIFDRRKIISYEYEEWSHAGKGVPWLVGGAEFDRKRKEGWRIVGIFNTFSLLERPSYKRRWYDFCLYHSRFLAKRNGHPFSCLCVADKLAIALTPTWLYIHLARLTGELEEYMKGQGARTPANERTPKEWYRDLQHYCEKWALEHVDGKADTWTGTKRDLAENEVACQHEKNI